MSQTASWMKLPIIGMPGTECGRGGVACSSRRGLVGMDVPALVR